MGEINVTRKFDKLIGKPYYLRQKKIGLFAHGKRAFTPSLGETHKFTQENQGDTWWPLSVSKCVPTPVIVGLIPLNLPTTTNGVTV